MPDLLAFFIGVTVGALAVFLPWMFGAYKKFVLPCGNRNCPHHYFKR